MSAIDRLLANYSRQVRLPWSANMSGKQRVWFAVYPPAEVRRVRARLPQFEAITLEANHGWFTVDLTGLLPEWVAAHEYREAIFAEPEHFSASSELEDLAVERVRKACSGEEVDATSVVVVSGLATLFDFMRVSSLIGKREGWSYSRLEPETLTSRRIRQRPCRAAEIQADVILKATKVDGVYDKDPVKHADAIMYRKVSYTEALAKNLKVMDATAISLCRENNIPIRVFNIAKRGNIKSVICGKTVGTIVGG